MTWPVRVFLDSNVLFSAAYKETSRIAGIWRIPNTEILTSQGVIAEASRHLKGADQRARLWRLIYLSHLVPGGEEISLPPAILLPEKDRHILRAAIAGNAQVLVTGDRHHFAQLFGQTSGGPVIEGTAEFLDRFHVTAAEVSSL